MASDRDSLVAELKYVLGDRDDLDTHYPNWVRRAYAHISQTTELPEGEEDATIDMVVSQRPYALPSDFFSIYSLRNNETDTRMFQVSPAQYETLLITATGHPDRYTVFKGQVYVHPTPDDTDELGLHYRKILPDLSTGASVHLLPDVWDQIIIQLAAAYGFEFTNELERATYFQRAAARSVREQRSRLTANLFDRSEPLAPIGGEIE
jgi:hypothetical protein